MVTVIARCLLLLSLVLASAAFYLFLSLLWRVPFPASAPHAQLLQGHAALLFFTVLSLGLRDSSHGLLCSQLF